ncbi:ATPase P-type K/Mg/Cd/Cu/Zn/Na/Ca/Na/H-transporter [Penicillium taxi]|uniref:ATPase P-type K/Mg/Cd/Cu/Zn/Na/Ca/Na/H-transporter n=1 Tax=Penicillium taxi TaxID=168475 RepID=UPI002545A6D9|nr:ATPase P-type K/Mg/Cd/Cu/Zn/Na/Ca/Na/H-transporter [Penicillium taxi]KAJ5888551.1 ATPase P-type K/Mg/Cd/Cu/Zn/Na/Ca/Na/H-transporter [Penicillium taxi]
MGSWTDIFSFSRSDAYQHLAAEHRRLLPSYDDDEPHPPTHSKEITKVALRLKYQIEQVVSCEVGEDTLTDPNSRIITNAVTQTARQAGGEENKACVVYCLLVCLRWFKIQAFVEPWDADLHAMRAVACEVIAKRIIESEEDQSYLLKQILLKRYSIFVDGFETDPANVIERSVDLHALRVISSSGYQKCIQYLWRGWICQEDGNPTNFVEYEQKANTDYWVHFHPDRMRTPLYQNIVQVMFSLIYLAIYTAVINTVNPTGDLDFAEGILYTMTLAFICDEGMKFWKVGWNYISFWNTFNSTLYTLLATSFILRVVALAHPTLVHDHERQYFNELSYNFLAFAGPMFWMRMMLYLDSFRFFGAMFVILRVMMKESIIFFALLFVVLAGFFQAFLGMAQVDDDVPIVGSIVQGMVNSVMQSPDFDTFQEFAFPFGIILYYIFNFVVMTVLLNILIALYNSAYEDVSSNSTDEYLSTFAQKTMQFVRAPDENVFIPPFNLIEIIFLSAPFEWWLSRKNYAKLNDIVMLVIYAPLLLVTAWVETRQADRIRWNRRHGEEDEDCRQEWECVAEGVDFDLDSSWKEEVKQTTPDIRVDGATIEIRHLKEQIEILTEMVRRLSEEKAVHNPDQYKDTFAKDSRSILSSRSNDPAGKHGDLETAAKLTEDPQIQRASLHNPLPIQFHTYAWPFLIIWPIFFSFYLSADRYDTYIQGQEWTFVFSGSIITAQSLLWLMTKWNININTLFTTTSAKSVDSASLVKVIPITNAGTAEICPLIRDNKGGKKNTSFLFQKRRFLFSPETQTFAPLSYVLDEEPKPALKSFQLSKGLTTKSEIERIQNHYGDNTFDIPVPTFTELFQEHAVAPFFVFQVFCVGLWMLDEYWYYSLFTLFMLVTFESTVVWQRQRTLTEFRGMSIKPYDVWVYRQERWEEITSDKLLPGDLMSVNRTKEDGGVACDILLVEGSAIVNEAMLSGESTPLLKDSVQLRPGDDLIEPEGLDKNSFVHGGTKVLQITHPNTNDEGLKNIASGVPAAPDNGALGVVVKTGFETSQGSLVRTMIYSTERVSANNVEALLFILFLLIFAIAASWYVWQEGVAKDRKRSKLLLDCVLIVTSVVPPELPMELSLAVNTSLAALSKYAIFCTEPFRIPFAGRVDIACFDKTGTLTGEDLVVDGIAGLTLGQAGAKVEADGAHTELAKASAVGPETTLVLASAHAMVKLDEGEVVGDPMEKATLEWLGWTLGKNDTLTCKGNSPVLSSRPVDSVQIKRRFQFSSALKRQSTIATITSKKIKSTFVGVKGAPETIRTMLVNTPPHYEETFKHFTRNGARVLALAYKFLSTETEISQSRVNNYVREEIESNLIFAGFLVLQCPLKDDAIKAVQMLNESSHRVVMITGDNPLTAVHVARKVEIVDREVLILDAPENDTSGTRLVWRTIDDKLNTDVDPTKPLDPEILNSKDICITGYALAKFKDQQALPDLLRHTWVYARVSPKQKEDILLGLKDAGYTTLMCGDGTNDVGALKQAHVGVALLNGSADDLTKIADHYRTTKMKELYEKQVGMMQRFNQPPPPVPVLIAHLYPPGPSNPHYQKAMEREAEKKGAAAAAAAAASNSGEEIQTITSPGAQALQQNMTPQQLKAQKASNAAAGFADKITSSMLEQELDDSEPPTIKLGDASVAAPFTSKLANVIAIPNIIRQGRCTLVATIQMYKILALNCLISAYSLSVIYLDGIKFGDGQVTISGMLMSVCFLSISRAKSVEGLSKERPQPNIFNVYIIGSVLGQFAIHIVTLIYITRYVYKIEPRSNDIDLEGEFEPSLLNSAIYLLQLIQQISTFSINYQGRPFRESIRENRAMYWGLVAAAGVAFSCATEFIPEVNEKLRLVPFSTEFKLTLTVLMIFDYGGCWLIENVLKHLFSDFRPKDIAVRRPDQLKREVERKAKEQAEAEAEREKKRQV